jgi:hypothetical protein
MRAAFHPRLRSIGRADIQKFCADSLLQSHDLLTRRGLLRPKTSQLGPSCLPVRFHNAINPSSMTLSRRIPAEKRETYWHVFILKSRVQKPTLFDRQSVRQNRLYYLNDQLIKDPPNGYQFARTAVRRRFLKTKAILSISSRSRAFLRQRCAARAQASPVESSQYSS